LSTSACTSRDRSPSLFPFSSASGSTSVMLGVIWETAQCSKSNCAMWSCKRKLVSYNRGGYKPWLRNNIMQNWHNCHCKDKVYSLSQNRIRAL
jgi:hypothetical protein